MDRFSCLFVGFHLEVRADLGATLFRGSSRISAGSAIEGLHGPGRVLRCRNPREGREYSSETVAEDVRLVCLNLPLALFVLLSWTYSTRS